MRFGPVPPADAAGAILAHSLGLPDGKLKKGTRLGPREIARIEAAGLDSITVARLGPDDVPEDRAAERIGTALAPDPAALGLTRQAAFTGRLNLYAAAAGLAVLESARIARLNALDEAVTLATVADRTWVEARQMVATVKIIPYAAPESAVAAAEGLLAEGPVMRVAPRALSSAGLVLTVTPGMKDTVVEKGAEAVRARLRALGLSLAGEVRVAHETGALAAAVAGMPGDMVLVLTGSATSDRSDVGPAGLVEAGGELVRFGMPVDPGNLLFLGRLGPRPVIGLPGCARSPKLNGADWVLERVAAGMDPDAAEIGAMGVGGLLKEIPARPQPRSAPEPARRPRVAGLLLAAGSSSRMGGRDKLLEEADGGPMIARAASALAGAGVEEVVVVLRPGDDARRHALGAGLARIVENPRAADGMGTSLAAGVAALGTEIDAVLVALGDMPELGPADHAALIAAFDPGEGREIVRATAADGTPGHPVLFGRRFFETLQALEGDRGARAVLDEHADRVVEVALAGERAITDLDTPEAWAAWRARQAG